MISPCQPNVPVVTAACDRKHVPDGHSRARTRCYLRAVFAACAAMFATASDLSAQVSYEIVADLGSVGGPFATPLGGVIRGPDGALYGTTQAFGGTDNCGTVYRLSTAGLTLRHQFSGPDGCFPAGELALGPDGSLYGITMTGGDPDPTRGGGTIYRITTDGVLSVLHRFRYPAPDDPAPELAVYGPNAGLTLAPDGWFYGTTFTSDVYRISPEGAFELVHQYTEEHDPQFFYGAFIVAPDGRLYTTATGTLVPNQEETAGAVFSVAADGTTSVTHRFLVNPSAPGIARYPEGRTPFGELAAAPGGVLYGTTSGYGPNPSNTDGGTIYRLDPDGALEVLHAFSADGNNGYPGGSSPSSVILGSDGYIYGHTFGGGANGTGVIYRISPDGRFTTLHSFGEEGNPGPSRLFEAAPGVFYGTVPSPSGGILYRLDVSAALLAESLSVTTDALHPVTGVLSVTGDTGAPVTFSLVSNGRLGVATIDAATGTYRYTPNPNVLGTDSFTFEVSDGTRVSNLATVIVTITEAANHPPVASDSAVTTAPNRSVAGTLVGSDPDGSVVTFILATVPRLGKVKLIDPTTGRFVYTPNRGAKGEDSFTFYMTDGLLNSNIATVRVTIVPRRGPRRSR